jgi:hypothetical protein
MKKSSKFTSKSTAGKNKVSTQNISIKSLTKQTMYIPVASSNFSETMDWNPISLPMKSRFWLGKSTIK